MTEKKCMHDSKATKPPPTLLSVNLFAEKHPAFTRSILRNWLFNRYKNGFGRCVVRIRRKLLIDETKAFEWIEEQDKTSEYNKKE